MKKRVVLILLALFVLIAGFSCEKKSDKMEEPKAVVKEEPKAAVKTKEEPKTEVKTKEEMKTAMKTKKELRAVIKTPYGNIELRFFPDVAPNHVSNFIELSKKGFYDGTVFHRVIPGFMIQGGDPNSKSPDRSAHGIGGPTYTLKAEFNNMPHKRGTLSMARKADPNSAGSQFFICVADTPHLDGKYTVFGEVTSGMDVVDRIVSTPKDERDNPIERIEMKIKIIE